MCDSLRGYTLKPLTFRAECGQPGISWDNRPEKLATFTVARLDKQRSTLATKCLIAKLGFVTALEQFNVSLHVAKLDAVGGWRQKVDPEQGVKSDRRSF
jgi:hypothetical protein